jgi:hypothetical protein
MEKKLDASKFTFCSLIWGMNILIHFQWVLNVRHSTYHMASIILSLVYDTCPIF